MGLRCTRGGVDRRTGRISANSFRGCEALAGLLRGWCGIWTRPHALSSMRRLCVAPAKSHARVLRSPARPLRGSCDASVRPHMRFCEDCARLLRSSRMAPARLARSMRGSSEARCEVPAKLLRGPCEGSAKPLRGLCEVRRIARTGPARLPRGFSEVCEAHRGFCEAPAKLLRAPCEGSARLLRGSCEAS